LKKAPEALRPAGIGERRRPGSWTSRRRRRRGCDPGSSQRRGVTGLKRCEYPQTTEQGDRDTRGKRPNLSECRNAPSGWWAGAGRSWVAG